MSFACSHSHSTAFGVLALFCASLVACGSDPLTRHYVAPDATVQTTYPKVAVLPPAFTLQIDSAGDVTEAEREALRHEIEARSLDLVLSGLRSRGYEPNVIDTSRARQQIEALAQGFVLHANTVAGGAQEGGSFDPAVLKEVAPGADAILYLNGSAVTVSSGRRAEQVAVIVTIAVVIAAIVVLIVLATQGKGSGHGGSGPGFGGGRVATPVRGGPAPGLRPAVPVGSIPVHYVDVYTPVWWVPPYEGEVASPGEPAPRSEGRGFFSGSQLRFFATLVDAPTGKILWHVDRNVDADAQSPGELRDEVLDAFSTLPARLAGPR